MSTRCLPGPARHAVGLSTVRVLAQPAGPSRTRGGARTDQLYIPFSSLALLRLRKPAYPKVLLGPQLPCKHVPPLARFCSAMFSAQEASIPIRPPVQGLHLRTQAGAGAVWHGSQQRRAAAR